MKTLFLLLIAIVSLPHDTVAQWQTQPVPGAYRLSSLHMSSSKTAYIAGSGVDDFSKNILLRTRNGGESWEGREIPACSSIFFVNDSTGYLHSSYTMLVHKTTDYGASWEILEKFGTESGVTGPVYFLNGNIGFAAGTYLASITRTTDGGKSSELVFENDGGSVEHFHFPSLAVGYAAGREYILKTLDTGKTWTKIYRTHNEKGQFVDDLIFTSDVFFVSETKGYIVGDSGKIWMTTDGGTTWQKQNSGVEDYLSSVFFVSPDKGYVAGSNGLILKTTDGGESWTAEHPSLQTLLDLQCKDGNCFAVGELGTIVRSVENSTGLDESPEEAGPGVYPNPVRDRLSVSFSLRDDAELQLSIFDMMGNQVLSETKKFVLGDHTVSWEMRELSQGIYIYRLILPGKILSGKFEIIR